MRWFVALCLAPSLAIAATNAEFSGDLDVSFVYNDMRSQTTSVDSNLYLFSSLVNLQVENVSKDGDESPWTFYASYQLTALDRYPVDRSGVEIDPYRYWARHVGRKTEVRLGMQKIVFGHARYLRPLQLFDSIDPTDFTKKTPGTKALSVKVFPEHDLQLQTWLIHNETEREDVHFGGRVNKVYDGGECGLTYHHWEPDGTRVGEDIFGFDVFADVEVGLWLEHASHNVVVGSDWNQSTLGLDYSFPRVGNGLHVSLEHMVTTDGSYAQLSRTTAFFFDTRLNDEDTLYGSYLYDEALDLQAVNLRFVRDLSDSMNGELGFDWVDEDLDELPAVAGQALPVRKGVSLRFVYSF